MESKKPLKARLSVTLTPPYIDGINKLIEAGVFLNSGDMIRQSLRLMFKKHRIDILEGPGELEEKPQDAPV